MPNQPILVWDLPTRLFHWLLAGSFAVAYITSEAEGWENVHFTAGFTLLGLIAFRLVWGLIGSRHVRFSAFSYKPTEVLAYVRTLRANPRHYVGHNPLGSMGIFLLLGLGLATATCGAIMLLTGTELLEEPHELFANAMLAVICIHIAGVVISGKLHGENLSRAMVTGLKQGTPDQAIPKTYAPVGAILLAAVLSFWTYTWMHPFDTSKLEKDEQANEQMEHDGDKD